MQNIKFSIVIPTRHRPEFIKTSLIFLKKQRYKNFEVIICDNYTDKNLSCKKVCNKGGVKNLQYIRPKSPLGMVENWNYALKFVSGDYVIYLTDKMFLLENTLYNLNKVIEKTKAEIVNWIDDMYTPVEFNNYFLY